MTGVDAEAGGWDVYSAVYLSVAATLVVGGPMVPGRPFLPLTLY
jgi:hypothetical protein